MLLECLVQLVAVHYQLRIDKALSAGAAKASFSMKAARINAAGCEEVYVALSATLRERVIGRLSDRYDVAVERVVCQPNGDDLDDGKDYLKYTYTVKQTKS